MRKLLLITILCLFGSFSPNAQNIEVKIGYGDDYTYAESPANFWSDYSFSQMIYTSDEINQENGLITSFSLRINEDSPTFTRNIAIYMQNTNKESFDDKTDYVTVTEDDLVFEGDVDFPNQAGGWVKMALNTPFKYTGGNLLVTFDDNTGFYHDEDVLFYHYAICTVEEGIIRTISAYSGSNNLTAENAVSDSDDAFDPGRKGYNICPQVKFDMILGDELPVLAVTPLILNLDHRANNAWNPAKSITISALENVTINSVTNTNSYFELSEVDTPLTLAKGESINIDVTTGDGVGAVSDVVTISYNDNEVQVQLLALSYDPKDNDVYELSATIEEFPFTVTPNFDEIYSNYTLPGIAETGKDVVYKIIIADDNTVLTASVEGTNGKVALYAADFGNAEGPMENNYFGKVAGLSELECTLSAGEYYIIASATEEFTLTVDTDFSPLPEPATLLVPYADDDNQMAPILFQWELGKYTTEYQLLIGTTNPPTDVIIDWTNDPDMGYILEEVELATTYYWQVKSRNSTGVTESQIRKFTTRSEIPSDIVLNPANIYVGEEITLSWKAVESNTLGYNIYLNERKVNEEVVTATSYTLKDLEYKEGGHTVNVTAVYEFGESLFSPSAKFNVCAEADVTASVFEQDGTTPITGTVITLTGKDEVGNDKTYTLSEANQYRCKVNTGSYIAKAEKDGYQTSEKEVVITYGKTNAISFYLLEFYYPVRWVKAEESEKAVTVSWDIEALATNFEDFELGSLTARDWSNDSVYPWDITEDAYKGEYAMKSTCGGVSKGSSSIEITVNNTADGWLSFYHKVSSELEFDNGNFYIDGELASSISGVKDWELKQFNIKAGKHVYKWEYAKDSLSNLGLDAYFIDDITFCSKDSIVAPKRQGADRAFASRYNVYKRNLYGEEALVVEDTKEKTYTDETWASEKIGAFQWGVSTIYEGNRGSKVTFSEDFESGSMPAGWTVYNEDISDIGFDPEDDQNWVVDTVCTDFFGNKYSSNGSKYFAHSAALHYANINRFYLVTHQMRIDPKTVLDFEYKTPSAQGYYSQLIVAVSESATGPWTNVWATAEQSETTSWTTAHVELDEYAGHNLYVAFIHQFGYGNGGSAAIDDIVFSSETPESEIIWSNVIAKDMKTKVTVKATTNSKDPVTGALVTFKNLVEPKHSYTTNLDETGTCVIENFRKGEYEFTVEMEGFESSHKKVKASIWEEISFECELTERLSSVNELYVSPTGYAMWQSGAASGKGDEFFYDFEDGTLNGWVTIDADGDKFTWSNFKDIFADETEASGHNGSQGGALSYSYTNLSGALTPDNYLVTNKKYKIGKSSQLRFWVCSIDKNFPEEHYGVAISTVSNTSASDFTTIWEETLPKVRSGNVRSKTSKNTRGLGISPYYERVIDLSEYEGQSVYIAIRHFDVTDVFAVGVDDISLVNAETPNRALQTFQLYLNDELVTDKLTDTYYQFEGLTEGQEYTTKVVPVYTTGNGEESVYTWTYKACDKFEGVKDFKAELINDEVVVTWTLPEAEVLGVRLYHNDELVSKLFDGEEYIDKKATKGDEYTLSIVYGGEKDETYYAITCPQTTEVIYNMPCESPKNLHAYNTINKDGTFGATLVWPYTEATSTWLHYDEGEFYDAIGGPKHFYWGIKFPISEIEKYAGASLTKLATYIPYADVREGKFHIYYGGNTSPELLIHSQNFSAQTFEEYVEFDLSYPLPISGEESIWVVIETELGEYYPAASTENSDNPNARWISEDGQVWEDIANSGINLSWMIRAYVSLDGRGTEALESNANRAPVLKNYNIYRGTSLDNIEKIDETTDRKYFDQVEAGKYYYQVKAVYEEFDETCESEAANSYSNPEQDYVVVEVSAIEEGDVSGLMIYPNPTDGNLNISVEAMKRITIVNALGQTVYDRNVGSDNVIIDMTQYEAGIYMLRIVTENGVAVERITVL